MFKSKFFTFKLMLCASLALSLLLCLPLSASADNRYINLLKESSQTEQTDYYFYTNEGCLVLCDANDTSIDIAIRVFLQLTGVPVSLEFSRDNEDNSLYCCDPSTMLITTKYVESHDYDVPLPSQCTYLRYKIRYCTNCGTIWENSYVGAYEHTHY